MNGNLGAEGRRRDHQRFEELAVGWALHALEPDDAAVFDRHVPGCPHCQSIIDETIEVMAAVAGASPLAAEPSDELRLRLLAVVDVTEQVHRADGPSRQLTPASPFDDRSPQEPSTVESGPPDVRSGRGARPRRAWLVGVVATAAAAITGFGVWIGALYESRDEARATAGTQTEIVEELLRPGEATLQGVVDKDGNSVATVLIRDEQVQVVTDGLAVNDDRVSTYVLWGIQEGSPTALGTFDVTRQQPELHTIESDVAEAAPLSGLVISIEPGRQAPPAPSDIIATG